MARHPVTHWLVIGAVALTSGLMVLRLTTRAELAADRYGSVMTVPVATRSVAAGDTVHDSDVQWRRVPRACLPNGVAARHPTGRVVVSPLVAGEVVVEDRLAPAGLRGAAALVPSGWRALAVPAGPGTPHVARGDRVDLLAAGADDTAASAVVAARALVVEVTDDAVTVAVDEGDAPALAAALARGTVSIALVGG